MVAALPKPSAYPAEPFPRKVVTVPLPSSTRTLLFVLSAMKRLPFSGAELKGEENFADVAIPSVAPEVLIVPASVVTL